MKIKELENTLGITRANIRFYEREGLLTPVRSENGYREYSAEDVERLRTIILFRKLGVSVADIRSLFDGELELHEAVENSISSLREQIEALNGALSVCQELEKDEHSFAELDTLYYLDMVSRREEKGQKFVDFCKDYMEFETDLLAERFFLTRENGKWTQPLWVRIALVAGVCVACGVFWMVLDRSGASFFKGLLYPIEVSLIASVIMVPRFLLGRRSRKASDRYMLAVTAVAVLLLVGFSVLLVLELMGFFA